MLFIATPPPVPSSLTFASSSLSSLLLASSNPVNVLPVFVKYWLYGASALDTLTGPSECSRRGVVDPLADFLALLSINRRLTTPSVGRSCSSKAKVYLPYSVKKSRSEPIAATSARLLLGYFSPNITIFSLRYLSILNFSSYLLSKIYGAFMMKSLTSGFSRTNLPKQSSPGFRCIFASSKKFKLCSHKFPYPAFQDSRSVCTLSSGF